jgi:hypothetical protein
MVSLYPILFQIVLMRQALFFGSILSVLDRSIRLQLSLNSVVKDWGRLRNCNGAFGIRGCIIVD